MIRFKNTEAKPQSYKLKKNLEIKQIKEKRNKRLKRINGVKKTERKKVSRLYLVSTKCTTTIQSQYRSRDFDFYIEILNSMK